MPDCLADTDIFLEDGCGSGYKCVACELPLLGETGACDYL
jgi:ferredoxin